VEVTVTRRLSHANVVRILDTGALMDGRVPFFVMDYLHGRDLRRHLEIKGRFTLEDALCIVRQVGDALSAAHALNIVHRDVKPSNVFASDSPTGRPQVVLIDFGLAKLLEDGAPFLTGSRRIVGTPASMAPEQILGLPVDRRTDVYGLACLTFSLLAGTAPFEDGLLLGLQQLHLHARVPNVSGSAPLPSALDGVIIRGMAKAPADRQPDVESFCRDLENAAASARSARSDREIRSVLAVFLEFQFAEEDADLTDASVLVQELFLDRALALLEDSGLHIEAQSGNTVLGVCDLPEDPAVADEVRGRLIAAAQRWLYEVLPAGADGGPTVARACALGGTTSLDARGTLGGTLFDKLDELAACGENELLVDSEWATPFLQPSDAAATPFRIARF
jgi:serine/threonine protein kinase